MRTTSCASRTSTAPASTCTATGSASCRSSSAGRSPASDIELFGDGSQLRDCLHVDDVVDALLLPPSTPAAVGEMFNLGHPDALSLAEIARLTSGGRRHGRPGQVRAVARRARAHRHRELPGRLRQGQARCSAGRRASLRRRHRDDGPLLPGPLVVPLVDLSAPRSVATRRPSSRPPTACCARGTVLLGPELEALRARGSARRLGDATTCRRVERRGGASSWRWRRSASDRATR